MLIFFMYVFSSVMLMNSFIEYYMNEHLFGVAGLRFREFQVLSIYRIWSMSETMMIQSFPGHCDIVTFA